MVLSGSSRLLAVHKGIKSTTSIGGVGTYQKYKPSIDNHLADVEAAADCGPSLLGTSHDLAQPRISELRVATPAHPNVPSCRGGRNDGADASRRSGDDGDTHKMIECGMPCEATGHSHGAA